VRVTRQTTLTQLAARRLAYLAAAAAAGLSVSNDLVEHVRDVRYATRLSAASASSVSRPLITGSASARK